MPDNTPVCPECGMIGTHRGTCSHSPSGDTDIGKRSFGVGSVYGNIPEPAQPSGDTDSICGYCGRLESKHDGECADCPDCGGSGEVTRGVTCHGCGGSGGVPSGDTEQEKRCPTCGSDNSQWANPETHFVGCPDPFHNPPSEQRVTEGERAATLLRNQINVLVDRANTAQAEKAEAERERDEAIEKLRDAVERLEGPHAQASFARTVATDNARLRAHTEQVATDLEEWADEIREADETPPHPVVVLYEAAALIRRNPTADADSVPGGSDLEE